VCKDSHAFVLLGRDAIVVNVHVEYFFVGIRVVKGDAEDGILSACAARRVGSVKLNKRHVGNCKRLLRPIAPALDDACLGGRHANAVGQHGGWRLATYAVKGGLCSHERQEYTYTSKQHL